MSLPALLLVVLIQHPIAITHVTVIDGADSVPRRDMTVMLLGNRITFVGPAAVARIPAGARVLDGRGKFLIPGLWDMHVHVDIPGAPDVLPLYIANGVTSVRDMGSAWNRVTGLRKEVRAGRIAGPRILSSGPYLDGYDQPIAHLRITSPAEARAAVDSLAHLGVDFVKLHTGLSPETWFAALGAARSRGMLVAGHVPRMVGAAAASDSGIASIEHLLGIPLPCTPAESIALAPRYLVQSALGRCSSGNLAPLLATLLRNRTWITPTFAAQYEVANWPQHELPGDAYAKYLPDTLRRYVASIFPMPDDVKAGADSVGRAVFDKRLGQVGALYAAGVGVLAGTDAPLRNSPPGFGLHTELELLVRAGLTPHQALRVASYDAARFLGMADSLGGVAVGQLADLVLLDANPLLHVRNSRRVRTVIADGRVFDARALLRRASR